MHKPFAAVLLAIVDKERAGLSVLHYSHAQGVLDDIRSLVSVELGTDDKAGSIVNPCSQIRLLHLPLRPDRQIGTKFYVALIKRTAM